MMGSGFGPGGNGSAQASILMRPFIFMGEVTGVAYTIYMSLVDLEYV